jgi:ribosomal protein S18 acetylase RimI-like enzyme
MIKEVKEKEKVKEFLTNFKIEEYSSLLKNDDVDKIVSKALERDDYLLLASFMDEKVNGVYIFLVIEDEKYLELLTYASKDIVSYQELMSYLKDRYSGFECYFVTNPRNVLLIDALHQAEAKFFKQQYYMRLNKLIPFRSEIEIVPYEEKYQERYLSIHGNEFYWTGEKVISALDRFKIYLAIYENEVVGYLDLSFDKMHTHVADIYVIDAYRNKGLGKALLTRALMDNPNENTILEVDYDNDSALHIYEELGFEIEARRNTITARMKL